MNVDGYCTLGVDREFDLTEDRLLAAMDDALVDRAVAAAVDRCLAARNREGNDLLLAAARRHPDRLVASCSANPWFGDEAAQEVRRALAEGARMVVLHPLVQGFQANDELTWPILELAAEERVPVYVHTGPPGTATPWQLVDLADRFPRVDLIMGHCGATDFWNDVPSAAAAADNIYIESSLSRPFVFTNHLKAVGLARGIMGSAVPLNDLAFEWEQMRAALPEESRSAVLGGNLLGLLAKRGAP